MINETRTELERIRENQRQADGGAAGTVGTVPVGGIIIWSGTVAAIPANWTLCDGTAGTPDLRSRFVIGAGDSGATYEVGDNGAMTVGAGTAFYYALAFIMRVA